MSVSLDLTQELTFHGVDYYLRAFVRTQDDVLVVEAEQKNNGQRWVGEFSQKDTESMTHKTGNFKKFSIFVKMLATAMSRDTETVFIDLLTYADLEMLKARKTGRTDAAAPSSSSSSSSSSNSNNNRGAVNNKRYLILTYVVEFDRVHYPLPLKFETEPNTASLQQTIQRLRYQLEAHSDNKHAADSREVQHLLEENHKLKQLLADRNADDEQFEQDQDTIAALEQENAELVRELQNRPEAPSSADRRKLEDARVNAKQVKLLQKQVDALRDNLRKEKALNQKVNNKYKKEYKQLNNEVEKLRTSEARFRQQTKKLTAELTAVRGELKRANAAAVAAARVTRRTQATNASQRARSTSRGISSRPSSRSSSRRASPSPAARGRSPRVASSRLSSSGRLASRSTSRGARTTTTTSARGRNTSTSRTRSATPPVRTSRIRGRIDTGRRSPSTSTTARASSRSRSAVRRPTSASRTSRISRPSSSYAARPYGASNASNRSTSRTRRNISKENVRPGSAASSRKRPTSARPRKQEPVIPSWEEEEQQQQPLGHSASFSASQDIADIDTRINKLQDFLKQAKSGGTIR